MRDVRFAQSSNVRKYRLEDGLQIGRRTANDVKHLACRRLLLQRFGEITIARLLLVNESCVLYGDHSLVGEGVEELDLPFGERPDLLAANVNSTKGKTFAKQWRREHCAKT